MSKLVICMVVFMDQGAIVKTETPDDVFLNPQSDRLRNFIHQVSRPNNF